MSRAYKRKIQDAITDQGGFNAGNASRVETLSGADMAQVLLAAENGSAPIIGPVTPGNVSTKTLNNNAAHGAKNNARLSGADLERFAGDQ